MKCIKMGIPSDITAAQGLLSVTKLGFLLIERKRNLLSFFYLNQTGEQKLFW